jgi:hypothetical protein
LRELNYLIEKSRLSSLKNELSSSTTTGFNNIGKHKLPRRAGILEQEKVAVSIKFNNNNDIISSL